MNARDRLAAIAARADAATPGPWESLDNGDRVIAWTGRRDDAIGIREFDYVIPEPMDSAVDAEFIAHARTDVPALVAFATAVLDELHTPFTADFAGVGARTYCVQCTEDSGYTAYPCAHVEAINRLADEHLGGTS